MDKKNFKVVNQAVPKVDAKAIMSGAAVYTDDLIPKEALIIKILRSPFAFAKINDINKEKAMLVPGIETILTYKDVPKTRFSFAGSNYPGNNPMDRLILENIVRYVGDPVALVVAKTEEQARKAMKLIKVDYEKLEPVLDFEKAKGNKSLVHPEYDFEFQMDIGGDLKNNVLSYDKFDYGNFEESFKKCDIKLDETYYTKQNQQAMMETFRSFSYYDQNGSLTVVSSTQIPFHARRIVARALEMPQGKVRVIKPRVGGGFGAKQSVVSEVFAAFVTKVTGKPSTLTYTREESFSCANTRHEFRVRVRLGANNDGVVKALWVDSLENVGAYCEHAVNVIGLSGHKTLPLYSKCEASRFTGEAVFTNTVAGGAFRGFGATQGTFAVESTVNKMAEKLGLDPTAVRLKNLPQVGEIMPAYYGEPLQSCSLDRCIETGKKMIGWDKKYSSKPFSTKVSDHVFKGLGMAITMQGSGLTNMDSCTSTIRLNDDDSYTLMIGAADMGTGCDTILAQMAAEILLCPIEKITVQGVDTDYSPYDKGSYASSTTYVTGNAVVMAADKLILTMKESAGRMLEVDPNELSFDGQIFKKGDKSISVKTLGIESVNGQNSWLTATASFSGKSSPPPFVAGFAEVLVDTETGEVKLTDYVGVVDCGTVVNKNLAKVQAEGGLAQGIGMALFEDVNYTEDGKLSTNSFMQYKIPSRLDLPNIRVEFEESYEPSGPFGAKSIGEVVINTPSPAIMEAVRNAVGVEIKTLPITAEKVFSQLNKN